MTLSKTRKHVHIGMATEWGQNTVFNLLKQHQCD